MREIIEIDKDFNLNSVKHSKKIKPNSKIKGKVNISLYDENNNMVRDIHTENLVMDWFKDETYERGFVDLIGRNTFKNSNFEVSPFSYLILSDQDIEEDSKDPFILKNTIGYAQRRTTYSGSDTLKGTYNEVESKTYVDEEGNLVCHEVYDFQTHACNGTIKSLMWSPHYTNTGIQIARISQSGKSGIRNQVYYDTDTEIAYTYLGTTYLIKMDFGKKTVTDVGYLETIEGQTYSNPGYNQLYIDIKNNTISAGVYNNNNSLSSGVPGKHLLCCQWDLETRKPKDGYKIYSAEDLKLTVGSDVYNFEGYSAYNGEYIYYSVVKSNNSAKKGVVKANYEDGSIVKYYLFDENLSTSFSILNIQDENSFIYGCGDDFLFDNELNLIKREPKGTGVNVAGYEAYCIYSNPYYTMYAKNCPASSYVKLSQPVTKTNTNTMKVQYDFVIEQPKVRDFLMRKNKA